MYLCTANNTSSSQAASKEDLDEMSNAPEQSSELLETTMLCQLYGLGWIRGENPTQPCGGRRTMHGFYAGT